jgi:protein gp37
MNPIGWCDITSNPISGCTNCDENGFCMGKFKCYAEGFAKRLAGKERKHPGSTGYPTEPGQHFKPTLHVDKLWDILDLPEKGKPKRIFLDSMSDWFCEGVPAEWVHQCLDVIVQVPQHHFLVLTKKPERIFDTLHCCDIPANLWLGVSVTCQADLWRISMLKESIPSATKRFISFEPLLGPVYTEGQKLGGVDWVIIGAQTGPGKTTPEVRWLADLFCAIPLDIPIFQKDNIRGISPVEDYQQFPGVMQ